MNCPICESSDYKEIKIFADGVIVGQCTQCKTTYTPKRHPNPAGLFEDADPEKLAQAYEPIISNTIKYFRNKNFKQYLSLIKRYAKGRDLLDIGSAQGFFIKEAEKEGFNVTGVEPSKGMTTFSTKYLNLTVNNGTLGEVVLGDNIWDVITITDSLEYFTNPINDLKKAVKHLDKEGVLFIKVPNGDYFLLRYLLKTKFGISIGGAEAYSPSMRVIHYNNTSIKKVVEQLSLKILKLNYIDPINSPVWQKITGLYLEFESPWYMEWKQKLLRKMLHYIGLIEYFFIRKNHFSQSVYIIAQKSG